MLEWTLPSLAFIQAQAGGTIKSLRAKHPTARGVQKVEGHRRLTCIQITRGISWVKSPKGPHGLLDIAVGIFITDEALSRIVEAATGSQGDFTQLTIVQERWPFC